MNGREYKELFAMVQEGRDASLSCLRVMQEHERRLGVLEQKVDKNVEAVAVGRMGVRTFAWLGTLLIGLGGIAFGMWEGFGGPSSD